MCLLFESFQFYTVVMSLNTERMSDRIRFLGQGQGGVSCIVDPFYMLSTIPRVGRVSQVEK